jgi:anti-sigma factor ChrR (cupin superfamily)
MAADLLNADFSQRVVIATNDLAWVPSPQAGVERRMLDRIGAEVARATSLERLAAGVALPAVECRGGEEIFLVSGDLVDASGSYVAGSWIRNPPGYRRSLRSVNGATFWSKRGHLIG